MATLNVRKFLEAVDNHVTLDGVPSTKHPAGKTYRVAYPDSRDGMLLARLWHVNQVDGQLSADELEHLGEFCRDADGKFLPLPIRLIGDIHGEMVADGVLPPVVEQIGSVLFDAFAVGERFAQQQIEARNALAAEAQARATPKKRAPAKKAAPRKSTAKAAK